MKIIERICDAVFYLSKKRYIKQYLMSEHPAHKDTELLYYQLFGPPMAYYHEQTVLVKSFLEDLELVYPGIRYINLFLNNAHQSDAGFPCWNQSYFLILIQNKKMMIEYDSRNTFKVYYSGGTKSFEVQVIQALLNKHKKLGWPWSYSHLKLN